MCKHLVKIKNPNFGKKAYGQQFGDLITVNPNLVPRSEYIEVPCGKCSECRQKKVNEVIQRAIIESLSSYVYFVTLTYDNDHLPFIVLNNEKFFYADYNDIQNMFKRFRANGHLDREFRYLAVNEYGDKKHRPHFHILMFVSKLESDDVYTPTTIQNIIYKHLGNYFSKNIGTRKHPIYEPLFTYQVRYTSEGVKTNYFVKFVENEDLFTYVKSNYTSREENVKAIRYLVGYVNKPSKYEEKVDYVIDSYKEDRQIYLKLRHLLKSQVRYSKGFGCGFENGKRFYLDKISVRCSEHAHEYSQIVDSLPKSYDEFCEQFPSFNEMVLEWRERDFYQHFSSWQRALNGMTSEEYMLHCVYIRYFSTEFSERYKRFKKTFQAKISNFFNLKNRSYCYTPQKVKTYSIKKCPLYDYLRQMVEESIDKKLLCISFRMTGDVQYVPMCKYYKDRCTTFDDTKTLYDKLGVKNYEEWLSLFEKSINNTVDLKQGSNIAKHYNEEIINTVDINKLSNDDDLYTILFTN